MDVMLNLNAKKWFRNVLHRESLSIDVKHNA